MRESERRGKEDKRLAGASDELQFDFQSCDETEIPSLTK